MKEKSLFEQFVEFCDSKPKDETYNYGDLTNCPLAQFGKSLYPGNKITAGTRSFRKLTKEPPYEDNIEVLDRTKSSQWIQLIYVPWTFGDLTKRLKAV